ncbi:MAG: carbon-nitrogen hydrolase family protein [Actinomycetota bacterium]|nr:carbon-nitrogen hydrolase family protein [Actinomycetota bacterium]
MRAAAVQLNSTEDRTRNLERADRLTREAAADGAQLIVLPEKFNVLGEHDALQAGAERLGDGPSMSWARDTARELGIDLVAGSIVERREGRDKLSNTSVHVGPDGSVRAAYRKIHMFDVTVGGQDYRESEGEEAGDEIVLSDLAGGLPVGLTVCFDLRFPELYRILAVRGARVVTVPSAFTQATGEAGHWEVLLRARAIENQAFVVAANQVGFAGDKQSFGASMIVDPWGEILARVTSGEAFAAADLDLARQEETREQLPSLANRVPEAYRWPMESSGRSSAETDRSGARPTNARPAPLPERPACAPAAREISA